jgi:hypothetical protein
VRVFESLTHSQKAELKKGVIEVTGKAMNRTALGIVDAMLTLYPNATFEELKEMLPDSINPSAPKNYKSLFQPYTDRMYGVIQPGSIRKECETEGLDIHSSHFTEKNETFRSSDGVEILVSRTWESNDTTSGGNDLQRLIDHVEKYGVRVTKVEKKVAFNKGDYHLEIINPTFLQTMNQPKKKSWVLWSILVALGLGLVGYFAMKN